MFNYDVACSISLSCQGIVIQQILKRIINVIDICKIGRFEKWLMWKCQDFQAILFLTHKSKIIGTIVLAL